MSTTAGWAAYLDAMEEEARLVGRLAVEQDAPAARPFLPPAHLGPLPPELAGRARDVLAALDEVSVVVRAQLESTGQRLADLGRHDVRGPKPPSSVDVQA